MKRRIIEKLKIPESVRIPILGGMIYQYLSKKENDLIKKETIQGLAINKEKRDTKIIVSMTSFPARINFVHIALKSLMLQSYKPDRIILWLANEQFPNHELPKALTELEKFGLEIRWCADLCSHKKYYYCIREQRPDEVVISFDDDLIYPVDAIKRLINMHKRFPDCLVCERAQSIDFESDGSLKNPGRWKTISEVGYKKPSYSLNPSPGGGCLIPFNRFYKDATDETKIRELAYKSDDLWYMFMAAENGTRTIKTRKYHKTFSVINGSQVTQLATENIIGNRYQLNMQGLKDAYPKAYNRILNDE